MTMQIYSTWLSLPIGVRHQLAHKLGIEKKFPTEVQDNQIKSDGYALKDIEHFLSIENLQKHLDTDETDHRTLLDWMIEGKPDIRVEITEETIIKKRGRPAKTK